MIYCSIHKIGIGSYCPECDAADSGYRQGFAQGVKDARESPDRTWRPSGAWSRYERGWNDGYNSVVHAEAP